MQGTDREPWGTMSNGEEGASVAGARAEAILEEVSWTHLCVM